MASDRWTEPIAEKAGLAPAQLDLVISAHVAALVFAEIAEVIGKELEQSRFSPLSLRAEKPLNNEKSKKRRRRGRAD